MKTVNKLLLFLCICFFVANMNAQKILYQISTETGGITEISIQDNESSMNWILKPDNSQYKWIGKEFCWGLGFFYVDGRMYKWDNSIETGHAPSLLNYRAGDIQISVKRFYKGNDLIEEYTFKNMGEKTLQLTDMGINTPFNDNYPDAVTCMTSRCHAHIWTGGSVTYVNAMKMNGNAPHLGLVLTKGSIKSYEISERSHTNGFSNFRGVIILNPEDIILKPKETYTLSWQLFTHSGWDDFNAKLLNHGSVIAKSDKYIFEKGEAANITLMFKNKLKNPKLLLNGNLVSQKISTSDFQFSIPIDQLGENSFELVYNNGKKTHIDLLCFSSYKNILKTRVDFILKHQQMNDATDTRFGSFMVYDNETEKIYLNDTENVSRFDRNEGAERVGMGCFLALYYLKNKDEVIKQSLIRYADFIRNKLQDEDYKTFSEVEKKGRNRAYNYPWVAEFFFRMFQVTGEKQYLNHGFNTMCSMYQQFGHKFYAINTSIELGYTLLKNNGMAAEADVLLDHYKKMGDNFEQIGINYPKFEVNFEQGIVAPGIISLMELYKITGERKYLESAEIQMTLLEAFAGQQPSYHLNDIAIRHWDGYWFGKREFWGDTFPHYWTTLSAVIFNLYAQITENKDYKRKAENIVRNNMCLFTEDGRGSCAYIYPYKVNGERAQFYDPYANDQDWAAYYYLLVNQ